jgi:hypothetical protein
LLVNPSIKFIIPWLSGLVPTSNKTQKCGLMCLQKPSKNHKWDDSFVPFVCLKQVISLSLSTSSGFGDHKFW